MPNVVLAGLEFATFRLQAWRSNTRPRAQFRPRLIVSSYAVTFNVTVLHLDFASTKYRKNKGLLFLCYLWCWVHAMVYISLNVCYFVF